MKTTYQLTNHLGKVFTTFNKNREMLSKSDGLYTELVECNPFGLEMSGIHTVQNPPENQYKYNAKEYQPELGWSDFGWRMYDASIGRWNMIDRLAERYISTSPYVYTLNNPLLYIDPDGQRVIVAIDGADYEYRNGHLYDEDGNVYEGDNEFATQVVNTLNNLSENSETAKEGIGQLVDSENDFTIKQSKKGKFIENKPASAENGTGSGGTILWNSDIETAQSVQTTDGTDIDVSTILGHEIGHAVRAEEGIATGLTDKRAEESAASHFENKIRGEMDKPLRTIYQLPVHESVWLEGGFDFEDFDQYEIRLLKPGTSKSATYDENDKPNKNGGYDYSK